MKPVTDVLIHIILNFSEIIFVIKLPEGQYHSALAEYHCGAIFHPPEGVDLVEKRPCLSTRSFFWWERTDTLRP